MNMGDSPGFYIDANNKIHRAVFQAKSKRDGMDLAELERAIETLRAQPMAAGMDYKVQTYNGFRGQIQRLILTAKEEEVYAIPTP